jgi:hypothetical protein
LVVPEDEPGVAAGFIDGVIDGWPSPGVRLVEQPNIAREQATTAAVMPPRKHSVLLSMVPPVGAAKSMIIKSNQQARYGVLA